MSASTLLTVNKLIEQGRGLAGVLLRRAPRLQMDWDLRQKSRFEAQDSTGRRLAVFLPRGSVVRGGDVLVAEDGSLAVVEAAPQPVLRITPCAEHGSSHDLLRAAYHLGNRHVAVELQATHLQIEPDAVLADMLRAMHLTVVELQAGFEPEGGAYAAGHEHGHAHGHSHDHSHGHAHGPSHSHAHQGAPAQPPAARGKPVGVSVAAAPHVHGPGCGHDHGHGHSH
jgi:urease accessory protein